MATRKMAAPVTRAVRPRTAPSRAEIDASLTVPEMIYVMRTRAGMVSHQELSDACRDVLPDGITMNRRLIQQLEHGDIPREEMLDWHLIAIAVATGHRAAVFGIGPGKSPTCGDRAFSLLRRAGWS